MIQVLFYMWILEEAKHIHVPKVTGIHNTAFFTANHLFQSLEIILGQFSDGKVFDDTRGGDGFGDHRDTTLDVPGKDDLSSGLVILLSNGKLKKE
jgi:hypothetical protein